MDNFYKDITMNFKCPEVDKDDLYNAYISLLSQVSALTQILEEQHIDYRDNMYQRMSLTLKNRKPELILAGQMSLNAYLEDIQLSKIIENR
ncbi:hypothetical protein B7939_09140 [Eggerthia catenaformis]|uniref:hypothetical protein n=2 Tax=Eggerthia catenaformis TaxID=31973 RepID=UPI000A37CEB7|nr:hypothetical protein [Eggerthia catenaformis]OUC50927.1 hypothetical protein B7939_09140 [Eggerthia catenaformis]